MNAIYDTILWLQPTGGGKRFPIVQFSADADAATDGWISLTSTEKAEVVVTQMTAEEYSAGDAYGALVEVRVNRNLGRTDLRHAPLVRVEDHPAGAKGQSFQEFRKTYTSRKCFYRNIHDPQGEAEEISRESRTNFEASGGRMVLLA